MRLFRRPSGREGDARWVVAGLGNPGKRYADTRHNAGVMVIEALVGRHGSSLKRHKSGCLIAEVEVGAERAILARPTSYMNQSGRAVRELLRWHGVDIARLVVVHDEIDLPFGDVRVKAGGGTAGHNGLASIVDHLGSKDFLRVRTGVGRPRRGDAVDHVLGGFSSSERKQLPLLIERAADAVERILEAGAERAMNEINTRA